VPTKLPSEGPYKGLSPYDEEDAPFFFGRETDRRIIVANLIATRVTLLYGPSGVGKSSVLQAGVADYFRTLARADARRKRKPEFGLVVLGTWRRDRDPLADLAAALREQVCGTPGPPPDAPPEPFEEALEAAVGSVSGAVLVVLDQFEEFFLYRSATTGPGTFPFEFARAIGDPRLRVNFLISMRDDALARLEVFQGKIPRLFDNQIPLRHLDRAGAEAAIRMPLQQYNKGLPDAQPRWEIEDRLVEAVLQQTAAGKLAESRSMAAAAETAAAGAHAGERIEAPYLQLVMTRLWQAQKESASRPGAGETPRMLKLETLTSLGSAETILRTHLDTAMDALPARDRETASRIFHHLVTPSGAKIALRAADLAQYSRLPLARVEPVLQTLAGEPRILRAVRPASGSQEHAGYEIYHDVLADAILDWKQRYRSGRRVRQWVWVAAALAALTLASFVLALRNSRLAASRELASAARNNVQSDVGLAIILGLHALDKARTREAEEALYQAVLAGTDVRVNTSGAQAQSGGAGAMPEGAFPPLASMPPPKLLTLAATPDGKLLATGMTDGTIRIWNAESGSLKSDVPQQYAMVLALAFDPQGSKLVVADGSRVVHIWDVATGRSSSLPPQANSIMDVKYSPDGSRIATAGWDGVATVWDAASGNPVAACKVARGGVRRVAFSADGRRLATAGGESGVRIWDAQSGKELAEIASDRRPPGTHDGVKGDVPPEAMLPEVPVELAFSHDGELLAVAYSDATVTIYRTADRARVTDLYGGPKEVLSGLAFSPAGTQVITAGERKVKIWTVASGRPSLVLSGLASNTTGLALSRTKPESPEYSVWVGLENDGIMAIENPGDRQALIRSAHEILKRGNHTLSIEECGLYLDSATCPPLP
jgi:hypothetical protein